MQTHVINVQLVIQSHDDITRDDIAADLEKQLSIIQEQKPYRGRGGAGWWTNSRSAVRIRPMRAAPKRGIPADSLADRLISSLSRQQ